MLHTQFIYIYIYIYIYLCVHEVTCDPFANVCLFIYIFVYLFIEERSQNYETRLLASSCLSLYVSAVHPSVCPHGTTRLPLNGFLWNFIFEDFSKDCRENPSFIKIWQTYWRITHSYIAELILEWEMFQTKAVEKIKTHFMFDNVSRKSCRWWDNVAKYDGTWQATDDNIMSCTKGTIFVPDN